MIRLKQAVIVEGKYDKIKLSALLDAVIITTDGFGIFKDKEKSELIRTLAKSSGLVILTDSDSAGFKIRNHIKGFIDEGTCHTAEIHQAYGFGKEINYSRDMMMYFSIAPEFDCEIKESRPKAAFARYDGAPTRSGLTTVEHPFFTHAYLFENSKIYRISYLKQMSESEILACELALKKSGGDAAWKAKMIEEFKRFAGSCREV